MGSGPHLYRRGATFWWRRRIPRNVQTAFTRHELAVSLRTHIPSDARVRAARLRVATDALFDGVRQAMALGLTLSKAQMDAIILDLIRHEIEAAEHARALSPPRTPEEAEAAAARARALRAALQDGLRLHRLDEVRGPLDAALARLQIPLAPDTPDYRFLQRQAAWGLTTVANVNERREAGIYEDDAFFTIPPAPMPRTAGTAAPTVPAAAPAPMAVVIGPAPGPTAMVTAADAEPPATPPMTIGQAFDGLIAAKSKSPSWVTNMQRKVEASRRLIIEAIGDKPLTEIRRADVSAFRDLIERLPANHGKSAHDRRTIREIADDTDAEERNRLDELEERLDLGILTRADYVERRDQGRTRRLTSTTINLHLDRFASAFAWAIENDHFSGRNPVEGVRLDAVDRDARDRLVPRVAREPWGREGLRALFATPAFQGEGAHTEALFWVPLIGAHAGLRPEEALQLQCTDIRRIDGVWCMSITPGAGKSVKAKGSHRDVPIHPTLIDLGLLDLAETRRRQKQSRLFPDIERGAAYDRFSDLFSKEFGRYTRDHGLWAPGQDLYSTRKDFNVRLREAGVPVGARKRLMGHVIKDLTDGAYDPKGESMATLNDYVARIDHGVRAGPNRRLVLVGSDGPSPEE